MIKFAMCLQRRPDMTREQFQEYWLERHGPFFQKHAGDMRAKKYVQSLTLTTPVNDELRKSRGMLPEFDGVAEVWFESEADMLAAMEHTGGTGAGGRAPRGRGQLRGPLPVDGLPRPGTRTVGRRSEERRPIGLGRLSRSRYSTAESSRSTLSTAISKPARASSIAAGVRAPPLFKCTTVSGPQKTSWTPGRSDRKAARTFLAVTAQVNFGVLAT